MSKNKNSKRPQTGANNQKAVINKAEKTESAAIPKPKNTAVKKEQNIVPQKAVGSKIQAQPKAAEKALSKPAKAEQEKDSIKPDDNVKQPDISLLQNTKDHLLSNNPVFIKALAIVPILGAAVSLKSGILLSCAMLLTVILLNFAAYPLNKIIPDNFKLAAEFAAVGVVITPVYMLANYFAPSATSLCGIYLPLIAVCALPMIEKKYYGKKYGVAKTAISAALEGLGFAFAAIIFSIIREIIGSGTLYGRPLPYFSGMKFSFALLPAGAFLLLGVLMALFRKIYGVGGNGEGSK